ncbi:hypothetical protein [Halarcobacter ebronensis]|uniref:Uncharacterized protein n=1 Tax=Halarcobacter ebronensis TaxID=1462615 RepID=A0A4Q1AKF3_9BACT|nr:hypothetical protein [Halarcobacter ebronensis]QKF83193.1 hypothetical protein AEBR_2737 [Halarcobacter ebronensis]RXK05171.1 hypothetical protein CRV07_09145 [Halarcobacter ebronensis]
MVVYIYGSESFKKDIHDLLEHTNIKFRLGEEGQVIDLNSINDLKAAIEDNPNNIYIIDDSKIIKNNTLNKKLKFLQPKDGIEQEYLLDNGIGDVSVDSMDDLSTYIKNKLDSIVEANESEDIHDSIVEIVEGAYEDENTDYTLDEELSQLLTHRNDVEEKVEVEQIDDISKLLEEDNKESEEIAETKEEVVSEVEEESHSEHNFELELQQLLSGEGVDVMAVEKEEEEFDSQEDQSFYEDLINSLSFEEDFGNIDNDETESNSEDEESNETFNMDLDDVIEENQNIPEIMGSNQGDNMAEEFSEFDTLSEADLLEALNAEGSDVVVSPKVEKNVTETSSDSSISLGSSSSEDIAKLISQLLNNKTLEITIKVKD